MLLNREGRAELRDLVVWATKLEGVRSAALPSFNQRPTTRLIGRRLFMTTFSPGRTFCLDRDSGEVRWVSDLGPLAGGEPIPAAGLVVTKNAARIVALDPEDGTPVWEFTPGYGRGEWLYSPPTLIDNRLLFGDRKGFVTCLDAGSGRMLWRRAVEADGADINSTFLPHQDVVIFGTNAGTAHAVRVSDGEVVWSFQENAPVGGEALLYQDHALLLFGSNSVLLDPATGQEVHRWSWAPRCASSAAVVGDIVCFVVGPNLLEMAEVDMSSLSEERFIESIRSHPTSIAAFRADDQLYDRQQDFAAVGIEWPSPDVDRGQIHLGGVDHFGSLTAATGEWTLKLIDDGSMGVPAGKVSVKGERFYCLTSEGYAACFVGTAN